MKHSVEWVLPTVLVLSAILALFLLDVLFSRWTLLGNLGLALICLSGAFIRCRQRRSS